MLKIFVRVLYYIYFIGDELNVNEFKVVEKVIKFFFEFFLLDFILKEFEIKDFFFLLKEGKLVNFKLLVFMNFLDYDWIYF